jgi:ABC-type dipeptide/oligopeptide/nickel transport system permease subunit
MTIIASVAPQPAPLARRRGQRSLFARLLRNRLALIGIIITAIVVLTALVAPVLAPYDPLKINLPERLQGPNRGHIMGTDHLGRDIFSRVVFGALISLEVGVVAVALGSVVGLIAGATAGYLGKRTPSTPSPRSCWRSCWWRSSSRAW